MPTAPGVCVCACVRASTAPGVCVLGWVKCREQNCTAGYTLYNCHGTRGSRNEETRILTNEVFNERQTEERQEHR